MIITIDGPAASGKSTLAKLLAQELNYDYIDSGAMYRAITWHMLKRAIHQENEVCEELQHIDMDLIAGGIRLNDRDLKEELRTDEVDQSVSRISAMACVREFAGDLQQKLGERGKIIMDGRDIGTVIFPQAELKFFLIASAEERARRRLLDKGSGDFDTLLQEIKRRDAYDSNRIHAPLRKADDAIEVDTTGMSIQEVLDCLKKHWKKRYEELFA